MAKELLETNGFKYDETMYEAAEDKKQFMDELSLAENISETKRVRTFPQIYIDGKRIGGYTELNKLLSPKLVLIIKNYTKL